MNILLTSIELSEGILETIKWWLPYLAIILIATIVITVIRKFKK